MVGALQVSLFVCIKKHPIMRVRNVCATLATPAAEWSRLMASGIVASALSVTRPTVGGLQVTGARLGVSLTPRCQGRCHEAMAWDALDTGTCVDHVVDFPFPPRDGAFASHAPAINQTNYSDMHFFGSIFAPIVAFSAHKLF